MLPECTRCWMLHESRGHPLDPDAGDGALALARAICASLRVDERHTQLLLLLQSLFLGPSLSLALFLLRGLHRPRLHQ